TNKEKMDIVASSGKLALSATLGNVVSRFRERRFNKLISGLENGDIKLTDHVLSDDSFIGCFLKTNEAIEKASVNEKVEFLTNLFVQGVKDGLIIDKPDLYSEIVTIFSDMSFREIEVLFLVGDILPFTKVDGENSDVGQKNEDAVKLLSEKYSISEDYAFTLISRLQRTGLVVGSNVLGRWPYVRTTQLYRNLKAFLNYQILGS
ncbi:hypothetical protein ACFKIV_004584, partial [Vibrio alginolyticus]